MTEASPTLYHPLLDALEAFYLRVAKEPLQPLNQIAEEAVSHWHRVLDGQDVLQPRLNAAGYAPTAFHGGLESDAPNRLDACGLEQFPEGLDSTLDRYLARVGLRLDAYFDRTGYRSSSDQCDAAMLEIARLSRFLNAWLSVAEANHERRWHGRQRTGDGGLNLYARALPTLGGESVIGDGGAGDDGVLAARWCRAFWEPYCNAALVAWEENQLDYFEAALQALREALQWTPAERRRALNPPGYPLRRRGRERQRVTVSTPEQRPLRSRSVLWLRFDKLCNRLASAPLPPQSTLQGIAEDVAQLVQMVESNFYLLASPAAFFERGRPGVPLIKGRPTTHPFLLDPSGLFKKAVLFRNNTYTVAGGGLDLMYLQLKQLERWGRFERWSGPARVLRGHLEACVLSWDENRWDGFTEGLLALAEVLRGQQ